MKRGKIAVTHKSIASWALLYRCISIVCKSQRERWWDTTIRSSFYFIADCVDLSSLHLVSLLAYWCQVFRPSNHHMGHLIMFCFKCLLIRGWVARVDWPSQFSYLLHNYKDLSSLQLESLLSFSWQVFWPCHHGEVDHILLQRLLILPF